MSPQPDAQQMMWKPTGIAVRSIDNADSDSGDVHHEPRAMRSGNANQKRVIRTLFRSEQFVSMVGLSV
jgi:hypothetical protein